MKAQMSTVFYKLMWYPVVFGLGMIVAGVIYFKLTTPVMWWAKDHPDEVTLIKNEYNLYHKAADMLLKEDHTKPGVTIVRPEGL